MNKPNTLIIYNAQSSYDVYMDYSRDDVLDIRKKATIDKSIGMVDVKDKLSTWIDIAEDLEMKVLYAE